MKKLEKKLRIHLEKFFSALVMANIVVKLWYEFNINKFLHLLNCFFEVDRWKENNLLPMEAIGCRGILRANLNYNRMDDRQALWKIGMFFFLFLIFNFSFL